MCRYCVDCAGTVQVQSEREITDGRHDAVNNADESLRKELQIFNGRSMLGGPCFLSGRKVNTRLLGCTPAPQHPAQHRPHLIPSSLDREPLAPLSFQFRQPITSHHRLPTASLLSSEEQFRPFSPFPQPPTRTSLSSTPDVQRNTTRRRHHVSNALQLIRFGLDLDQPIHWVPQVNTRPQPWSPNTFLSSTPANPIANLEHDCIRDPKSPLASKARHRVLPGPNPQTLHRPCATPQSRHTRHLGLMPDDSPVRSTVDGLVTDVTAGPCRWRPDEVVEAGPPVA